MNIPDTGMARRLRTRRADKAQPLNTNTLGVYISLLFNPPESDVGLPCPVWPPDLFAVVASVLYQTGEYRQIIQPATARGVNIERKAKWRNARSAGRIWRRELDYKIQKGAPSLVEALSESAIPDWWQTLNAHAHVSLNVLAADREIVDALLMLFFAADEACAGLGMTHLGDCRRNRKSDDMPPLEEAPHFHEQADLILKFNGNRSLCMHVKPEIVCVLPKLHTAQVGLTLRSLSHNLALCRASGIQTFWNGPYPFRRKNRKSLNILLLPWPDTFDASSIEISTANAGNDVSSSDSEYFRYVPQRMPLVEFSRKLERAILEALRFSGEIHAVIFPELALDERQLYAAERIAWRYGLMLVAGVQSEHEERHLNLCVIQPLGLLEGNGGAQNKTGLKRRLEEHRILQSKHHRWCIDRNQILQYRLGGRLPAPAAKRWWEHIDIPSRLVNFVALENWLTWCVLICEDLARQDPAAQVLRAVGPNLVIALLMDGPQILQRWPAKYASVLAEDPGSSVLTLSNLGMVRRSQSLEDLQPRDTSPGESVVALWSDRVYGRQEIKLTGQEDCCVLNLVCHSENETTADGHSDDGRGHFVVYAGHHAFSSEPSPKSCGPRKRNALRRRRH